MLYPEPFPSALVLCGWLVAVNANIFPLCWVQKRVNGAAFDAGAAGGCVEGRITSVSVVDVKMAGRNGILLGEGLLLLSSCLTGAPSHCDAMAER